MGINRVMNLWVKTSVADGGVPWASSRCTAAGKLQRRPTWQAIMSVSGIKTLCRLLL